MEVLPQPEVSTSAAVARKTAARRKNSHGMAGFMAHNAALEGVIMKSRIQQLVAAYEQAHHIRLLRFYAKLSR